MPQSLSKTVPFHSMCAPQNSVALTLDQGWTYPFIRLKLSKVSGLSDLPTRRQLRSRGV